jgi:hypothetical protein
MALFVEKRRNKSTPRVYPLAVIKGEILGMTIRVEEPAEFKEEYPFVWAASFQELAPGLCGEAMMLSEGNEEKMNIALDSIESGGCIGQLLVGRK